MSSLIIILLGISIWGFPGDSDGKESACNVGVRSQAQSLSQEDFPGERNGYPLQYS